MDKNILFNNTLRLSKKILTFIFIFFILSFHLWSRLAANNGLPLSGNRDFYQAHFEQSLCLMLGKGLTFFKNTDAPVFTPVKEFFKFEKSSLSEKELEKLMSSNPSVEADKGPSLYSVPFYLVAMVWKLFGVSWKSVFYMHIFISFLACAALIAAGFRIAGPLGGIFSGLFFTLSGIELFQGIWTLRDTSPCWFLAILLGWFFFFAGRKKGWLYNIFFYLSLGFVSVIGNGWRLDCIMFIPLTVLLAVLFPYRDDVPWLGKKSRIVFGGITLLSALINLSFLYSLSNPPPKDLGFHVAYYGNAVRANLFNIENSFTTTRLDSFVNALVSSYAKQNASSQSELYDAQYKGPTYGTFAKKMYMDAFKHQGFVYEKVFFKYFLNLIKDTTYPIEEVIKTKFHLNSFLNFIFREKGTEFTKKLWRAALILGFLGFLLSRPLFMHGIVLILSILGYTTILLLVLPEEKHYASIIPFLSIFGGAGAVLFFKQFHYFLNHKYWPQILKQLLRSTYFVSMIALLYLLILGITLLINDYSCKKTGRIISNMPAVNLMEKSRIFMLSPNCIQVEISPKASFGGPMAGIIFNLENLTQNSKITCYQDFFDPEIDKDSEFNNENFSGGIVSIHKASNNPDIKTRKFVVLTPAGNECLDVIGGRTVRITLQIKGGGNVSFDHFLNTSEWKLPAITAIVENEQLVVAQSLTEGSLSVTYNLEQRSFFKDCFLNSELLNESLDPNYFHELKL